MTAAAEPAALGLDLRRLLAPSSVAVVGATDRPGSYAAQTLLNLEQIGFGGPVWGVNPGRTEVLGRPCVPSVTELPEPVDAVVVAIPAAGVAAAIEQTGARGCGGAVVFSAGFAEVAGGGGHQRDLVAAAQRHRLPLCGPNGNGIVSPGRRVALWGDALAPLPPGPVALVSQSGNVAVNALSTRRGLRFHTVIASGNQAVLSAADYLEFLAVEDGVRSVALYLEDDGGPRLCDALAACADAGVAVSVLKVGSSRIGARAAAAHSGALAGDQRVFRSLVAEAGAAWADDVHELLELAKTMATGRRRRPAAARGLAIMTCSGGDSAQGADGDRAGAGLLRPAGWSDRGDEGVLARRARGRDAGRGPQPGADARLLDSAGAARRRCGSAAGGGGPAGRGRPAHRAAVRAGAARARRGRSAAAARDRRHRAEPPSTRGGGWLSEHAAKQLLRDAGVRVPDGRVVIDADDAVRALVELAPRIVLKLSAASVQHKSELGGVALGLESGPAVREAYARLEGLAGSTAGWCWPRRWPPPGWS